MINLKSKENFRLMKIISKNPHWGFDKFYGQRVVNLQKTHHIIVEVVMWDRGENKWGLPSAKWSVQISR